jgi:serine/threonine protein kinase
MKVILAGGHAGVAERQRFQVEVIHRGIKTAVVLLSAYGSPKLVDFSLAKRRDGTDGFMQTGAFMGSFGYMRRNKLRVQSAAADGYYSWPAEDEPRSLPKSRD